MDGTLIDSSSIIANSINYVRGKISLPPMQNDHIISCVNNVNIHAPSFFYEVERFEKKHEEWFREYYSKNHTVDTALYDGILSLIKRLSNTHKLSIATNAYEQSAKQILDANNITHYFDIIMCADLVEKPKPNRQMIDVIINHYSAKRDEFVVIGDGERDILAAKDAGIDSILVDWGFSDHKEAIRSVKELEDILF